MLIRAEHRTGGPVLPPVRAKAGSRTGQKILSCAHLCDKRTRTENFWIQNDQFLALVWSASPLNVKISGSKFYHTLSIVTSTYSPNFIWLFLRALRPPPSTLKCQFWSDFVFFWFLVHVIEHGVSYRMHYNLLILWLFFMVKNSFFSEYPTQWGNAFLKTFITDQFSFFPWVYESDCCMQYMSLFEICFNYRRDVHICICILQNRIRSSI